MRLIIDRFEDVFAICEDEKGNIVAIRRSELPLCAREGEVFRKDENGKWIHDHAATETRLKMNSKRLKDLLNRGKPLS